VGDRLLDRPDRCRRRTDFWIDWAIERTDFLIDSSRRGAGIDRSREGTASKIDKKRDRIGP
jgi:hypothetical protein